MEEEMSQKERGEEKNSQCYQHSLDATANARQQQPHALK